MPSQTTTRKNSVTGVILPAPWWHCVATALLGLAVALATPAMAAGKSESPYEPLASSNGTPLVLKEEPSQNADIKAIMERYKKTEEFEKIASMPVEQRRKIMEYYKKGREAGVKDRLLAGGISSIVLGYADIADVRTFVEEYQRTGKKAKSLPMPYTNFAIATERFPEAAILFASELENTKKMQAQIQFILDSLIAESEKRTAEIEKRTAEIEKRTAESEKRTAEIEKRTAEIEKRTAESEKRTAEYRKQIEALDRILKLLK